MRFTRGSSLKSALTILVLVLILPSVLSAQKPVDPRGNKGSNGNPSPPGRKGNPGRSNPSTVTRTRIIRIPSKTTALTVVAVPNANVIVTNLQSGEVVANETLAASQKSIGLDALKPGLYRINGSLDGYTSDEKTFNVVPGKPGMVDLNLVRKRYDLTINLNADSGQVMFRQGNDGPQMMMKFQNKRAVLSGLYAGKYNLDIEPDDPSFEQQRGISVNVPVENNKLVTLNYNLSTKEFSSAETSTGDWELPTGWRFGPSGAITAGERGVALPRASDVRHYKDFQLVTDVRMLNGVAVSFALRAVDAQNYYLIQLTGAKADEPYVLRGFIVQGGQARPFPSKHPISQLASTLKSGKDFNLRLTVKGGRIDVTVTDSETAESLPLGSLEDPDRTFSKGAVGVAVHASEKFVVGSFNICVTCPGS